MSDEIWTRAEVDSPCVKLCSIHPVEGICIGCLRSLEEIGAWSTMSQDERRGIMATLPDRAPRIKTRRGGARGRRAS
ncbi:MAG: DUF1289 domain-containing protein [Pseudomonadota bacterium]